MAAFRRRAAHEGGMCCCWKELGLHVSRARFNFIEIASAFFSILFDRRSGSLLLFRLCRIFFGMTATGA